MITTDLPRQGNVLFRHRSFIPVVMVVPMIWGIAELDSVIPHSSWQTAWTLGCFGISCLGLLTRAVVIGYVPKGTSGRNTKQQVATQLNTTGFYSLVRHPLYLANFLIWFGLVLSIGNLSLATMFIFAFAFYYERIMAAEESYLAEFFGIKYRHWAESTPAFLPRLHGWKSPPLRFSIRNVLKREYCALLGITNGFAALNAIANYLHHKTLTISPLWSTIGTCGLIAFFVLRTLKRHTTLLHVSGR